MKYIFLTLLLLPITAAAQGAQDLVINTTNFLGNIVVPFLLGIAFLIFVINVIRYFVAGAGDADSRENARALATYSVLAFVVLITFWGIVNMLSSSIGLDDPCPTSIKSDYVIRDDPDSIGTPCAEYPTEDYDSTDPF